MPVFCYTSYPEAELFVNGKSYGKLRFATPAETERLAKGETIKGVSMMWFDVPYKKGKIEVVAYDADGKEAARESICTAGKPHHLEVICANESEKPEELCYMTIRVVDKKGNLCPFANNLITYKGDGFVAAANGDAACLDSFVEPKMHAFAGQCTFIVKKGSKGQFQMQK